MGRAVERRPRLIEATQLIEGECPVDMRFDIRGVRRKRVIELLESPLGVAEEALAETGEVTDVGKIRILPRDLLEQTERDPVVARLKGLACCLFPVRERGIHPSK